ncbi:cytochrome C assembly family protein [Chrysiogenes arsenatis]|uniref:cytochrome C assembly family protein n=1 Tax=Chrysiogenes arsenatis TaxID=309797 RepID=UPI00041EB48F|nr:cytochrome c biogenesis protein CcsA [Chrysiogenes arsenatis]
MEFIIYHLSLALYLVASWYFFRFINDDTERNKNAAYFSATFGVLLNFLVLGIEYREYGYLPLEKPYVTLALFAFSTVALFLTLSWRYRFALSGAFVMPLAFVGMSSRVILPEITATLPPELRSHFFSAHIILIVLAFASFFLAVSTATLYLVIERKLKSKDVQGVFFQRIPNLSSLIRIQRATLYFGLIVFTLGLAVSILWSYQIYGQLLILQDPKTIASLFTWLLYAVLAVLSRLNLITPRQNAYGIICAIILALITMTGIGHFFPSGEPS